MAIFDTAYKITAKHEGGYVNNPADRGGETYKGIARNYHESWSGWQIIDQVPDENKNTNAIFINAKLDQLVKDFYKKEFWSKLSGDKIKNQSVANLIYDWRVNSGRAMHEIQKVLGVTMDGKVGKNTLAAINAADPKQLIEKITTARKNYYTKGVAQGWLDYSFYNGLIARADSFLDPKELA